MTTAAANALRAAGSVQITMKSSPTATFHVALDMRIHGSDETGTTDLFGHHMQIIVVGGEKYTRTSDAAAWLRPGVTASAAAALTDKWVQEPDGSGGHFGSTDMSITSITEALVHPTTGGQVLDTASKTSYNGRLVWKVSKTDGSYLLIAATGTAYPLFIGDPKSGATVVFSNFGLIPPVVAPAGAIHLPH